MLTRGAPPEIDREAALVVACAAGHLDRVVELLASPVDWDTVAKLAVRHGIEPLVAHSVLARQTDVIPPSVIAQLREELHSVAPRGLNRARELLRVTAALEHARIPAIPYKGPALAQILYDNLGLRDSVDLDILVRKEHVAEARDVLFGLGYTLPRAMSGATFAAALRSDCELGLVHPEGHLVELQWAFTPSYFSFPMDFNALFARRQAVSIGGGTVHTLGAEDLLAALCIHGTKHQWTRLSWIADVARLLDVSPAPDSEAQQRQPRVATVISLGVTLARELRGDQTPQDPAVAALARKTCENLWRDENSGMWPQLSFYLAASPRSRDKAITLWRFAATPTAGDCATIDLPARLSFLYYLVRPFRLFGAYVLRLGRA